MCDAPTASIVELCCPPFTPPADCVQDIKAPAAAEEVVVVAGSALAEIGRRAEVAVAVAAGGAEAQGVAVVVAGGASSGPAAHLTCMDESVAMPQLPICKLLSHLNPVDSEAHSCQHLKEIGFTFQRLGNFVNRVPVQMTIHGWSFFEPSCLAMQRQRCREWEVGMEMVHGKLEKKVLARIYNWCY